MKMTILAAVAVMSLGLAPATRRPADQRQRGRSADRQLPARVLRGGHGRLRTGESSP